MVCWRAWYDLPDDFNFHKLVLGRKSSEVPWFKLATSEVLGKKKKKSVNRWCLCGAASAGDAMRYLEVNYNSDTVKLFETNLVSENRKRSITICSECLPLVDDDQSLHPAPGSLRFCDHVVDPVYTEVEPGGTVPRERFSGANCSQDGVASISPVLGLSVEQLAPAVAALSDQEEMVLALVHPLVQVFTIPRTGQLAYVGHICNFRQKVSKFLCQLPTLPKDMPIVRVKPRKFKTHVKNKILFPVDTQRLWAAFCWLKQNNPWYRNVVWDQDGANAWEDKDVEVGVVKECDDEDDKDLPVGQSVFESWLQHAVKDQDLGESGYPIGQRVHQFLVDECDRGPFALGR